MALAQWQEEKIWNVSMHINGGRHSGSVWDEE